uniref:Uncharacterized protein n=1 Tax=Musa acuminata subsp. malaccensis TaxID=214687 RepID=A0A804HWD5_MUSAM
MIQVVSLIDWPNTYPLSKSSLLNSSSISVSFFYYFWMNLNQNRYKITR